MTFMKKIFKGFKKGCDYLGLEELSESVTEKYNATIDLSEHIYPSIKSLMPYKYYDSVKKIFFNKNNNSGVMYRIIPLTGANERVAEQLDNLIRTKISSNFTMQVILVKHNQVGNELDHFSKQFDTKDFENLTVLGQKLNAFYTNAAINGFKTNSMISPRLTHTECYIIVDQALSSDEKESGIALSRFKISFEGALTAAKVGFMPCDPRDLLRLTSFYLNNDPNYIYPQKIKYDSLKSLNNQVTDRDFTLKIKPDHLSMTGINDNNKAFETEVSTLTIDKLPEEYMLWKTIDNTNNIDVPEQSIPCNHIISVTYQVEESSKAQGKANRKANDLEKKSKSDYSKLVANTAELAASWKQYRSELAGQKTSSVKMLYNVILISKKNEREKDIEATLSTYLHSGIKLSLCKKLQINYFLASMPFLFTGNLEKTFSLPTMRSEISSWNATQYMPILSDWTGCDGGVLFPTNREQFSCIDPFSGVFGTNYNIAITGTAGAGKSFAQQMILLNVLFKGGDVFIIDIGGSYRKLCETLGGIYLEYENLAMNPFTHVKDIMSEIDEIISLFELLACPRTEASDDDVGTLREAIFNAFHLKSNETLIDDVQSALLTLYSKDKETYPSARLLSKNLQRYASNSEHGNAFNLPSSLDPNTRFIVVDLQGIEDNTAIRAPVLLSVISQFQRRMFDSERSKQKMCIIDEAWKFFTGDKIAANFITKGFRTGRKHNASFVTITQGVDDYFEFDEARAAWDCSALKLIFLQDQSALREHQKKHETFSEYEINLLNKFPKAKEAGFSQVLIKANGVSSFHRLFVDPYTLVMLSSDGRDYEAVKTYKNQGLSLSDSVSKVADEHYGVLHAA